VVGSRIKRENVTGSKEEAVSGLHRGVIKVEQQSLARDVFGHEDARRLNHPQLVQRQRNKIAETDAQ
jgi:hypothetical protein